MYLVSTMENKYTRNCPNCTETIEYVRKYARDMANKENKICYSCKMNEKHGNPEDWFRLCPTCNDKITYTNKGNMQAANKVNKNCLKCTKKETRGETEFLKLCPKCSGQIYFKNKVSLDESTINNAQCGKCRSTEAVERQTGLGNLGMMKLKYGDVEGQKKFEESETKRKVSFKKYWIEHPDELEKLMDKREGFKCKFFQVANIRCQGTSEKYYIEYLVKNNLLLPIKPRGISTPLGYYFPDFEFEDYYVEIKSPYTYEVLKKENNIQYLKIKWVANNFKPIKIISINNYKNKMIENEIVATD